VRTIAGANSAPTSTSVPVSIARLPTTRAATA
jgi:hypothetical protein